MMRNLNAMWARQIAPVKKLAKRFAGDESGIGAVEFALVLPIVLVVYLMAFQLTVGFSTGRKAASSAAVIADLVSQQATTDTAYLETMEHVAASILAPYATTGLDIEIDGIIIDANSDATVSWAWDNTSTAQHAAGEDITVPDDLNFPNSFLVRTQLTIPVDIITYLPGMSGTQSSTINVTREFYFRQRTGDGVDCKDC